MAYNVKITYTCPTAETISQSVAPIGARYTLSNSYNDTVGYDGSVYDTNVKGWGDLVLPEPYASTSFPYPVALSQFKVATIGEDVLGDDGQPTGSKYVEFEVETYMEAWHYQEAGVALAPQGFEVEVTKA